MSKSYSQLGVNNTPEENAKHKKTSQGLVEKTRKVFIVEENGKKKQLLREQV